MILLTAFVVILGLASLGLTGWFLVSGPVAAFKLSLQPPLALALDAALCLLFFIQHSVMVRRGFRRRLGSVLAFRYHGLFYTFSSALALFALVLLWQPHPLVLVEAHGAFRLLLGAILLLSGAGFLWAVLALHSFDPFGIKALGNEHHQLNPKSEQFVARGPYRWVRHPIYFFSLLVIWTYPVLSADRLLFNTLWTLWIITGTILEERDLAAEFGDAYTGYQRRVPMLLPQVGRPFRAAGRSSDRP
jgi:protein-S-isoprenylcysteine O-methyltransferase Ste14